jgi:hypothetical protein
MFLGFDRFGDMCVLMKNILGVEVGYCDGVIVQMEI